MSLPYPIVSGLPLRPGEGVSELALVQLERRQDKQSRRRQRNLEHRMAPYSRGVATKESGGGNGFAGPDTRVPVGFCRPGNTLSNTVPSTASGVETIVSGTSCPDACPAAPDAPSQAPASPAITHNASHNGVPHSTPAILPPLRVASSNLARPKEYTPSSLQAPPALRLESCTSSGTISPDDILWPNEALTALGPFPLWPPAPGRFQWSQWEREAFAEAAAYMGDKPRDRRGLVSAELAAINYHVDLQYSIAQFSDLTDLSELEDQLESARKSGRKWYRKSPQRRLMDIVCGYDKLAGKNVLQAQLPENTVFDFFSLEDAVAEKHGNPDKVQSPGRRRWTVFNGDKPRRATSGDKYDLVYHFPRAFRGTTLENLEESMLDWAEVAPMDTKGKNDFRNSYKEEYAISGRTRLALLWHAIGHRKSKPVVCADVRKTGDAFEGAMTLLKRLEIVSSYCMRSLLCIDPLQFGLLGRVYDYRISKYKSQEAFAVLDKKMMWEGREVMFNRWSPRHWDSQDPPMSWACITYVGDFQGAYFEFPQLKLRLKLQPGDVVFFRGHDLLHGVPEWATGQRHFLVHFTHQALWEEAGVPCASSRARGV